MRSSKIPLAVVVLGSTVACGGGSSSSSGSSQVQTTYTHSSVALADLNGDGALDLAVSRGRRETGQFIFPVIRTQSYVSYRLKSSGQAGLGPAVHVPVGSTPGWIGVNDLNQDGLPDILVADKSGAFPLRLLFQDPSGQRDFLPPITIGNTLAGVVVVDLTGDGLPDILRCPGLALIPQDPSTPGTFLPEGPFLPDLSVSVVAVKDVNGDGWADLGVSDLLSQRLAVVLQASASPGNFLDPLWYPVNKNVRDLAWLDTNQDGLLDLVALIQEAPAGKDHLRVWTQQGSAPFALDVPPKRIGLTIAAPGIASSMEVADLNSDGLSDLAIAAGGSFPQVLVLLQDARFKGAFVSEQVYSSTQTTVSKIALGDLNGDDTADLVISAKSQTLVKYQNKQSPGKFGPPTVLLAR